MSGFEFAPVRELLERYEQKLVEAFEAGYRIGYQTGLGHGAAAAVVVGILIGYWLRGRRR